jgi:hypothetical protein
MLSPNLLAAAFSCDVCLVEANRKTARSVVDACRPVRWLMHAATKASRRRGQRPVYHDQIPATYNERHAEMFVPQAQTAKQRFKDASAPPRSYGRRLELAAGTSPRETTAWVPRSITAEGTRTFTT